MDLASRANIDQNVPTTVARMVISMETFNIRDLRNRTGDLVRLAESGQLSLVTKHGHPVFIAVPFDEILLRSGVKTALAVGLFVENKLGLAGAAKVAGVSPSEMLDILAERKIPVVDYSKDELLEDLKTIDD